jgi:O-antigen/teichoic acid export membrane protein
MHNGAMKEARGIAERTLGALRWNYLGTAGRIAAQFVSQILLARLLGPEPVGVFACAFLIVSLCALLVEMGLGAGLVQARELDDSQVRAVSARLLLMGAVTSLGVYAFADTIAAGLFSTPEAGAVIRAMAPTLVVTAAAIPASALLRRELEFGVVQAAEIGSYVFGYLVVGVGSAASGLGVWSLVLAWYAQTTTSCVALYVFSRRRPWPGNPLRRLSISRFGAAIMTTNLLNWMIEQGTHVAAGRFFGAAALGQFTMSNNLVRTPANHLVVSLQSVLFPMAARAHHNDAGLRRAYLTALTGVGLVAFPTFAFVALMAGPIVQVLLGPKWIEAAPVLAALSAAMIPHAAMAICGPLLSGRGEPEIELRLQALTLLLMGVVLVLTSQWSLVAMAWGLALVYLCRCLLITLVLMRRLAISPGDLGRAIRGPGLLTVVTVAAAVATEPALHALGALPAAGTVLAVAAVCAAMLIALTLSVAPFAVLGPQMLALIDMLQKSHPAVASLPGLRRIFRLACRTAG